MDAIQVESVIRIRALAMTRTAAFMLLLVAVGSTAAPLRPQGPCVDYMLFLEEVRRNRDAGYPPETYEGVQVRSYREGARFIFEHSGWSTAGIQAWIYGRYDLCRAGKFDPFEEVTK